MSSNTISKPWHQIVRLKEELRSGELSLAEFAADLPEVTLARGQRPVYEDPERFFTFTYPTHALRELVKDVAGRLAGKSDKAVRQLEVTYGGGKTHTLQLRERDNPWPELLAVHEIGHYLDIAGLPGSGHQSTEATMPEMAALLRVIYGTATWRAILRGRRDAKDADEIKRWDRLSWPLEAFARAYTQYIAWKSGDATLRRSLDERMAADQPPRIRLSQWSVDEFLPIAAAMDKLFEKAGWLTIR